MVSDTQKLNISKILVVSFFKFQRFISTMIYILWGIQQTLIFYSIFSWILQKWASNLCDILWEILKVLPQKGTAVIGSILEMQCLQLEFGVLGKQNHTFDGQSLGAVPARGYLWLNDLNKSNLLNMILKIEDTQRYWATRPPMNADIGLSLRFGFWC